MFIHLYILANDIGIYAYVFLKVDSFFGNDVETPNTDCGGFSFTSNWIKFLNPLLYFAINVMQTLAASWVSLYLFYKNKDTVRQQSLMKTSTKLKEDLDKALGEFNTQNTIGNGSPTSQVSSPDSEDNCLRLSEYQRHGINSSVHHFDNIQGQEKMFKKSNIMEK
jgi:hypothetical protein